MNTEVIVKSSGKAAVVDSADLVLDQPSIVKIKVGPETVDRFEQVGNDLLIVLKDGSTLTIRNFFVQDDEGHRSDLVLEDVEGVHWWGQYTSPWSDFHFAEIQEDAAAAAFVPPAGGLPGWAIAALALIGVGAVAAASDGGGGGGGKDDVEPANRPPAAPNYTHTIAEDTPIDGKVSGTDADGDTLTYAVTTQPANGTVTINPQTGEYTYTPKADYNGPDSFVVTVTDGHGGSATSTVTIAVTPVNEAPEYEDPNAGGTPPGPNEPGTIFTPPGEDGDGHPTPASYTINYNENSPAGAELGQVQAGDADGDDVTFAISGGNDDGWYAIDPATGVITLTPAGAASLANDYETTGNSHAITVTANDGHGGTTTITVTLNELDANEAPEYEDPNAGGTPPGPNEPGTIFTPPGEDGDGHPTPASYTINYNENSPAGAELGQVQAGDADGDDVTFAISGGNDDGWYAIDPATGVITLTPAGAASLANDYETTGNSHAITVTANDGHGGTTTITVTLNELDVNDSAPVVTNATADTLYESGLPDGLAAVGEPTTTTATGTIIVTDPDTTGPALALTLSGPTDLTANGGTPVIWSGDGTAGDPLVGTAGGVEVFRATISANGDYEVTLSGAIDQPNGNGENTRSFDLAVRADDGVNPPGVGTLTVNVVDDQPSAVPVAAEIILPEQDSNIMLMLDLSGSMTAQKMALMKQAASLMLDQYDALGDVRVRIVTFGTNANTHGSSWESVADAKAYVQTLTANLGNTNYDAALLAAMTAFGAAGKIAGGTNISYFLTDGEPTRGTDWPQIPGNSTTAGIQPAEAAVWQQFLTDNHIYSHAYGMGSDASQANMDPVAYDGVLGTNTDAIVVPHVNDLPPILRDSVGIHQSGGVLDAGGGVDVSMLGADGGHVASISVNGVTYDFAGAVSGGASHGTWNATDHTWTINTSLGGDFSKGGKLVFDMDTGEYTYTPPITDAEHQETVAYTLIDNDGDTTSSTLTITVHPVGTVLPDDIGTGLPFSIDGGEGIAVATGEEPHALPALTDLIASSEDRSLDALLFDNNAPAFSGSLAQVPVSVPPVHPLDELDQHHQAMV